MRFKKKHKLCFKPRTLVKILIKCFFNFEVLSFYFVKLD